jgi:hypothetical protein
MITQQELHERFEYVDGKLFWKKCQKISLIGKRAGAKHNKGYRTINLSVKSFMEHQIIFMFHHGYIPEQIDHINGIKNDNRIENLRAADNSKNQWNVCRKKKTQTGVKGVRKLGNKYQARISVNSRMIYLGTYETLELATSIIQQARALHHGEFARN